MSRRQKITTFSRRTKLKKADMNRQDRGPRTMWANPAVVVAATAAQVFAPISEPFSKPQGRKLESIATCAYFPSFDRLPAEIRLKIWHTALPTRILSIQPCYPINSSSAVSFICLEPPPALLSVCRESRYEALRHYIVVSDKHKGATPSLRRFQDPSSPLRQGHRFYFNPRSDTIYVDCSTAVEWLRILRGIEKHSPIMRLALRNAHLYPRTFAIEVLINNALKEIVLVGDFREFGWTPDMWILFPRRKGAPAGVMGDLSPGGVVACVERWITKDVICPNIMAVREEFWMREGMDVVARW